MISPEILTVLVRNIVLSWRRTVIPMSFRRVGATIVRSSLNPVVVRLIGHSTSKCSLSPMLVTRVGRRPTKLRDEVPWTPVTWYVFLVMLVMLMSFGAKRILAPESISTFLVPFFTPRVVVKTVPEVGSGGRGEGARVELGE